MNYQIIKDEKALWEFINFLPELQQNEKYYLSLFARKKYAPDVIRSSDKTQLKRFLSNKEKMFDKIKQLECELGAYKIKDKDAPQHALVLYISPNPRDIKKATYQLIKKAVNLLESNNNNYNIHQEAMSCIQRSRGTGYFVDFDIDTKNIDLTKLNKILPRDTYHIIETNGGYHILVESKSAPKTKWFKEITNTFDVDQTGDQLLPVPGCVQGDFIPRFLKYKLTYN